MGAVNIIRIGVGTDFNDAFERLCEEAERRCGDDPYNGEINNCNLVMKYNLFDTFNDKNVEKARKFINQIDEDNKYIKYRVDAIDLGIDHYRVPVLTKRVSPYSGKYSMKYVLMDLRTRKNVGTFDTRTEADKAAAAYAEKHMEDVVVSKEMVSVGGNVVVTHYECDIQIVKKPKKAQASKAVAYHKYLFFGTAPE